MSAPGSISPTGPTGLPPVNKALEPEWVRRGSASTQKAYDTALSFEATLVEELSQSLSSTSGLGGESSGAGESSSEDGGSSAPAGAGELSSLLPQALTGGVMKAGGLGLAAQLTRELQGAQIAAQARATGGTSPVAGAAAKAEGAAAATAAAKAGSTATNRAATTPATPAAAQTSGGTAA